jgi:hypothetical protein
MFVFEGSLVLPCPGMVTACFHCLRPLSIGVFPESDALKNYGSMDRQDAS